MEEEKSKDDEFIEKYEAHQNEATEDFIHRYSSTDTELKETISYLIQHRRLMKDVELERLEIEANKLARKLKDNDKEQLLEEINCFKDVLKLQRTLIEEDDKSGDRGEDKKAGCD